jgi:hypothetical protein
VQSAFAEGLHSLLDESIAVQAAFWINTKNLAGLEALRAKGLLTTGAVLGGVSRPLLFTACYALWLPGVLWLLEFGAKPSLRSHRNPATGALLALVDCFEDHARTGSTGRCDCRAAARILEALRRQGVTVGWARDRPLPPAKVLKLLAKTARSEGLEDVAVQVEALQG